MASLPWYVQIIVGLAVKYGPEWLLKAFPQLPEWAMSIIKELLDELSKATTPQEKKAARKRAAARCKGGSGVACETELKNI